MLKLFRLVLMILLALLFSPIMHVYASQSAGNISLPAWFSPCFDGSIIEFLTGFEKQTHVISRQASQQAKIIDMSDADACEKKNKTVLPQEFRLGKANIQFQGGAHKDRKAQIIEEPGAPDNQVLQFWLQKPNVLGSDQLPLKGRVQMNVYDNKNVRHVRMSVRMYLHPDFNYVRSYPGEMNWLTISEWWNNAGWTNELFPFRIAVNIIKENPKKFSPLVFKAHAQIQTSDTRTGRKRWSQEIWENVNRDFIIPVGQWVTLEYGFLEGNKQNGHFFLAATVEGGKRVVIFNIGAYTQHPDDPNPDGLSHFNPIKLYTSSKLTEHVRSQGGALQILWDDLQLTVCPAKQKTSDSACAIR